MKRFYHVFLTLLIFAFNGGLSGIALWIIHRYHEESVQEYLMQGMPVFWQCIAGTLAGLFFVFLVIKVLERLPDLQYWFFEIISSLRLSFWQILVISLTAAIGEELLFRAAIQPFLGVWLTSILFILLHGYLNPFRKDMFRFGTVMVGLSACLGYLYEWMGIWAAMMCHFVYDLIILLWITKKAGSQSVDFE